MIIVIATTATKQNRTAQVITMHLISLFAGFFPRMHIAFPFPVSTFPAAHPMAGTKYLCESQPGNIVFQWTGIQFLRKEPIHAQKRIATDLAEDVILQCPRVSILIGVPAVCAGGCDLSFQHITPSHKRGAILGARHPVFLLSSNPSIPTIWHSCP